MHKLLKENHNKKYQIKKTYQKHLSIHKTQNNLLNEISKISRRGYKLRDIR